MSRPFERTGAAFRLAVVWAMASAATASPWNDEVQRLHLESFDYIWTTVRDKHPDPTLGGIDWEAVREELRPQVEAASSAGDCREAMETMLGRLGQSHFQLIPKEVYELLGAPAGDGTLDGETGIEAAVVDGTALVRAIIPGSPAEATGVRQGWEIVQIAATDVPAMLRRIAAELAGGPWRDGYLSGAIRDRLLGRPGGTVAVRFRDETGNPAGLEIPLVQRRGSKHQLGHLPAHYVWIETARLADDIGYIAFNAFLDPAHLMPAFNEAMEAFLDAPGLVIDLRGNGGGLPAMVLGMAAWLVADNSLDLGTVSFRDTVLRLVIRPRPRTYGGPLAILVDELSACASEVLAGGLRELGRARLFGSRTLGALQASAIEMLPNGDGFQYAMGSLVSNRGEQVEGRGIAPDTEVRLTRDALLQGRDPALEAAVAWIGEQMKLTERADLTQPTGRRFTTP